MSNVKNSIVLTIILSLLLSFSVSAETVIPFEGEGTQENPYLIGTAEEMYELAEIVNGGYSFEDEYLKLTSDVLLYDLSDKTAEIVTTWTPIGVDFSVAFRGTFDGDNHTIRGVYINSDKNYQALFGCMYGGAIRNVILSDSYIKGHYAVAGIVAGHASAEEWDHDTNAGVIENCINNATIVNSSFHTGGVVAFGMIVKNCINNGDVTGTDNWIGGVAAYACRIENCVNNGNVNGTEDVAGVCYSTYCEQEHKYETGVFGCTNNGIVKCDKNGFPVADIQLSRIENCTNNGEVITSEFPGFMLGDMDWDNKITAADARKILRCAAKLDGDWDIYDTVVCGDFDNDGRLTAKDARQCLRYAAGLDDYYKDFGVNIK